MAGDPYREAFRVVTGTAAPIIALAQIVAYTPLSEYFSQLGNLIILQRWKSTGATTYSGGRAAHFIGRSITFLSVINLTAQGILLAISLLSIESQRTIFAPVAVVVLLGFGLLMLMAATNIVPFLSATTILGTAVLGDSDPASIVSAPRRSRRPEGVPWRRRGGHLSGRIGALRCAGKASQGTRSWLPSARPTGRAGKAAGPGRWPAKS